MSAQKFQSPAGITDVGSMPHVSIGHSTPAKKKNAVAVGKGKEQQKKKKICKEDIGNPTNFE
jgi:hypothetical protein